MKVKTSELSGVALDLAVARCEGAGAAFVLTHSIGKALILSDSTEYCDVGTHFQPSINWAQGGPIIERNGIELFIENEQWQAYSAFSLPRNFDGDTPLVAAMRCFVASQLGDEVELPDELLESLK